MSSDGGKSSVGSDAVGQRGGSQQRRGPGREMGSELSCSSKKKQKDRANQESREAKRAVAVVDGVIAEVKKGDISSHAHALLMCPSGESDLRCADNIRKETFQLNFPWHQSHPGEEGLLGFALTLMFCYGSI